MSVSIPMALPPMAMTPDVPPDACYTVSYKHKKLATHPSEDECSHHRNQIQLPRHIKDLAGICVRVNGKPVHHQVVEGSEDSVVIGPVAGPNDTITAHFCVGSAKCKESCDYPKKEVAMRDSFIDAIGGDSAEDDKAIVEGSAGAWQQADAHLGADVNKAIDPDMKKELQGESAKTETTTARKPASQTASSSANLEIFKEWLNQSEKTSCVKHES